MSISVDYTVSPWLITIPKTDLSLELGTKYLLTVDTFWQLLRDYADSPEGIIPPVIYTRTAATASTPSITEVNDDYYELQFEDGLYSVNIINGNTNIRNVEIKNQVSVNTNNTTGFINPTFLEAGLFDGGISLNQNSGVSGTGYTPSGDVIGTISTPSNNITDTVSILGLRGFNKIYVNGITTLDATKSLDGYHLVGNNRAQTLITFVSADTGDISIESAHIQGSMNGSLFATNCNISNITGIGCTTNITTINNCDFDGNITLRADNIKPINIVNSGSTDSTQMILDVNGTTGNITIQNYADRIKIINMTSAINIHVSSAAGCELTIDSSCTAVNLFEVHGNVNIINESNLSIDDDTTQELVWLNSKALTFARFLGLK